MFKFPNQEDYDKELDWLIKLNFEQLSAKLNKEQEESIFLGLSAMLSSPTMQVTTSSPGSTWIYPDGTTSFKKPRDGEWFIAWDSATCMPRDFQWDDVKGQWFDKTNIGRYGSSSSNDAANDFDLIVKSLEQKTENKCECGSESIGSPKHSSWCQKWTAEP